MNALSRTEFRNISQVRKLQTLLDAKHDKIAAAKKVAGRDLPFVPVEAIPESKPAPARVTKAGIAAYLLVLAGAALLAVYWTAPTVRGFVEMLRSQP